LEEHALTWKLYGDIAFYGCSLSALLFVVLYAVLAPWWKTMTGRNIMAVMASLALGFCYFAFAINRGGVPHGFYPVRALVFTFIFLSVSWRVAILIKVQLDVRKEKQRVEEVREGAR
jgi:hypothetical protein